MLPKTNYRQFSQKYTLQQFAPVKNLHTFICTQHCSLSACIKTNLRHRVGKRILLPFLPLRHFCIFVIFAFSSFLHFYTSAGQTCIAVVSKSKIDEEKLSSGTNDDYPDLANHARIGTLRYCHHHKPLLYSKNFAKLFSTQRHASSCGDVLGLCVMRKIT